MTTLGWTFLGSTWAILTAFTVWCFWMVLKPDAKPHETDLPPAGRM